MEDRLVGLEFSKLLREDEVGLTVEVTEAGEELPLDKFRK
jgi:hypothetical protein